MAERWNELLAASRSNSVFLTWDWIELWWKTYGGSLEPLVLLAEDEGRWIGIAPLMTAPHPGPGGRHLRTLEFLGQGGDTLSEYLDFIVAPGHEAAVAAAFADHLAGPLRGQWDAMLLQRVLKDSPNVAPFMARFAEHGIDVTPRTETPSPYVQLPATMEALLASKSGNFRYQYQRSRKRLDSLGGVRLLQAGRDLPVAEALRVVASLNVARWQELGSSFKTERYSQFHGALAERFAERGWLWLYVLALNDEPIAARYDYVYGGKVWCMQGGWKPERQNLNPGTVMTGEVIAWAIKQGLREYDFLGGEDHYKRRWADGERTLVDLEAFNTKTVRGRWWPRLRALKHALSPASAG